MKVINPNIGVTRHQREVLEREIEVIRRLKHVNMVRCLDVEEEVRKPKRNSYYLSASKYQSLL